MKFSLLMIPTLLFSLSAFATGDIVVDKFHCTLNIQDIQNKQSYRQEMDLAGTRMPKSVSTAPDVRMTAANNEVRFSFADDAGELFVNVNMYYEHALKYDVNRNLIDARQNSCGGIDVSYCPKGDVCLERSGACAWPIADPFDPINGWSKVSFHNNVAEFDQSVLAPATFKMDGKFSGELNCKHTGTYN